MSQDYGVVYFIGPKHAGPVKVGYTSDRTVEKRLRQLQTGSSESYVVLGTVNGGPSVEKTLHSLLAPHAVRGEWFERAAALAVLRHLDEKRRRRVDNSFAIALADAMLELEAGEKTEQKSLAARVASDLIHNRVNDLLSISIDTPIPFRAWLLQQELRNDPTGGLALDVKKDETFPPVGTLEEYLRYITGRMSNPSVTRAVFDAWVESVLAIKGLPYRDDTQLTVPADGHAPRARR